jgi:hypothetical protein
MYFFRRKTFYKLQFKLIGPKLSFGSRDGAYSCGTRGRADFGRRTEVEGIRAGRGGLGIF